MATDEFNGLDESHRASFLERLGVQVDDDRLRLDVRAGHLRTLGIAHGGVIATLLDSVMGMVANRSSPPDHYLVTAQLNVHFLRPALEGETLVALGPRSATPAARRPWRKGELHTLGWRRAGRDRVGHLRLRPRTPRRTRANPDRRRPDPLRRLTSRWHRRPARRIPRGGRDPRPVGRPGRLPARQQHGLPPLVRVVEDRLRPAPGALGVARVRQRRADPGLAPLRLPQGR